MSDLQNNLMNIVVAPKTAATVAGATATTGFSTLMAWLPSSIGEVASLVGIVLSTVLIYVHIRRSNTEKRESDIKIAILKCKKEALERGLEFKRIDDEEY